MYRISVCAAVGALFISGQALAQQKQQVSFKVLAENTEYIISQNVDVGDVPNHIVRVFDTHFDLPNKVPTINGLKLAEFSARGTGDITDGNGVTTLYFVFLMENGDKVFARNTSVVQSVSGKITATTVGQITGGTGRLAGIQGVVRQVTNVDPRPGAASPGESQYEIESQRGGGDHSWAPRPNPRPDPGRCAPPLF